MPSDARLPNALPGPVARPGNAQGKIKLPAPLAAGVLPPDDSRMWLFVPKAVQQGESFIQDDTRDWFDERERKVVICREYVDHPRWLIVGTNSIRARMHNAHIVAEVHMLARLHAGKPEYPDWVPARMTVKQQQADLAFRLSKTARETFVKEGKAAMEAFAQKAPGQFIKTMMATFIPKKIESDVTVRPGEALDPEAADQILAALNEELKRRAEEAKVVATTNVLDYEDIDVAEAMQGAAKTFEQATVTGPAERVGTLRGGTSSNLADGLKQVVDLEADVPAEVEWD